VNNHAGALDVFQELDSETVAEVCAFDQPRQVGDGERPLVRPFADRDDSQVRFERGEGVVGDLGFALSKLQWAI
jgi:hypothetical protein